MTRLRRELWEEQARPEQLPPPGDWLVWYIQAGRGAGKTRAGAENFADMILSSEPGEWAVIAPTYGDARDVCVESDSGLLKALSGAVYNWNRSTGEIQVANGSKVFLDGADDGALRIQGRNLRGAWCDEIGLWRRGWRRAWEESLRFAVRLAPGKIIASGTPKGGTGLVPHLLADPSTVVTRMRTLDNADNLSPPALEELMRLFSGRRLGRQELEGELMEDVEGALWTLAQIDALRVDDAPLLRRIVVAVDPNASSRESANNAGIVVVGIGRNGLGYVLDDRTITSGGPRAWAKASVDAYHDWSADRIVAEKNNGGDMVELTIKTVDAKVPVKLVTATRGKRVRAEPIAALYEGDDDNPPQVHHVGTFPDLELEMTTWTPEAESPDRMDALVWGLSELMLLSRKPGTGRISVPDARIPGVDEIYGTSGRMMR